MKKRERDFEDILNTAEAKDFFFRAEREMFPILQGSKLQVSIFSGKIDGKIAIELGAAILFNKPILLAVLKGAVIPEKLRLCADAIIELSDGYANSAEDAQKVQEAVTSLLQKSGPAPESTSNEDDEGQ